MDYGTITNTGFRFGTRKAAAQGYSPWTSLQDCIRPDYPRRASRDANLSCCYELRGGGIGQLASTVPSGMRRWTRPLPVSAMYMRPLIGSVATPFWPKRSP